MCKTVLATLVLVIFLDIVIGVLQWADVIPNLNPFLIGAGSFVSIYMLLLSVSQNT